MNTTAYQAARNQAAAILRDDRGLLELTGDDRAKWINNLITNVVLTLRPGDGNYAFVINVKGRTQFDLNLLVRPGSILLDIDRRLIEKARAFLDRYVITEQVEIHDRTPTTRRIALVGPQAHEVAAKMGFPNLTPMAWLQNIDGRLGESPVLMFRHDFTGLPGAEFIVMGDHAARDAAHAIAQAQSAGATLIDDDTLDVLRIEAGIPQSVDDIDEEVIPPETGQIERGINYKKGCYLGQEVIERMRAHNVLARRLVGIKVEGDAPLPRLTPLEPAESAADAGGAENAAASSSGTAAVQNPIAPADARSPEAPRVEVGRSMSGCLSPGLEMAPLSLAYVKTAHAKPGTRLVAQTPSGPRSAEVVALPIGRM